MSATQTHSHFMGVGQEKVYYDERKKRFFSTKGAPIYLRNSANASYFKDQRPDLYGIEKKDFQMKLKYGQYLIKEMQRQNKLEMKRLWRIMNHMSYNYFYPLMDDYMKVWNIDRPRILRTWTW